jgi:hypothetical protein
MELNPANYAGPLYTGEIDGVRFAALHGNTPGIVTQLSSSGKYALVLHGHTHRRRDQMLFRTRVINPGALGGLAVQSRSFCTLDFKNGELNFIEVPS